MENIFKHYLQQGNIYFLVNFLIKLFCNRVTVECPFQNINVLIECLAFNSTEKTDRDALHVESISEWAPACIGPYSQSYTVFFIIY
jgi:hypothetical protein